MVPANRSFPRHDVRRFFRRGASLGRTLILSVAILLGVAGAHRMAVSWLIDSALEKSKEAIAECAEFPAMETPFYLDASAVQGPLEMSWQDEDQLEASEEPDLSDE